MHIRRNDAGNEIHIKREIPLWGIISMLVIFAGQAISLYYGQQTQGVALLSVQTSVTAINAKLDNVQVTQNKSDLKDMEHDLKLASLTNRITALEAVLQRQMPPQQYIQQPQR